MTGPKGLAPGVIPEKTPSAVQSTHQSLRQFRDTPRVLRYAPVKKKEEVTPTWGRRKEEVGEICPEKIKDVELRSEREKKDLSSRRTVRRVSQLGSGSPGVASLPVERGGLPCSREVGDELLQTPEEVAREFSNCFATAVPNLPLSAGRSSLEPIRGPVSSMVLSPASEDEVAGVIRGFNTKKSCDINSTSI
ncbi:hypothetical protein J6590_075905 [Homalodisca vitripennis]|nr:hypothetical protein J6590_066226 [Homalodisca vitripennis]KAG8300458.1 hypothetical protein J6590_075905 [Homalodisca vitripennis]